MVKFLSDKILTNNFIKLLICTVVIITFCGIFSTVLASNDANFYAIISKNIYINNEFMNLTFNYQGWLDKPHLQFWITALSYKLFGVHVFSYILPGFIFYLLGAIYLYLFATHLFKSKEVGLLSMLIYLTSLHLMLSSIDVRQEAFLLGEIIPACYYWFLYDECKNINLKYLFLGAFFSALALMTKGVFLVLIIFSGIFTLWIINQTWHKFISKKWLCAFLLVGLFTLPELISLYIQFDAHPEKLVFGKTHVSGIKWFFWDSQFGRFFNNGPIVNSNKNTYAHYFFFIHTLLWALIPWSIVAIFALFNTIKSLKYAKDTPEHPIRKEERKAYIYILGTIVPIFILFSATSFQLDHYTNIIIPFIAILCADFLFNTLTKLSHHPLFRIQIWLSYILCILISIAVFILFHKALFVYFIIATLGIIICFILLAGHYPLTRLVLYSIFSVCVIFVFIETINSKLYSKYDVGYMINKYIVKQNNTYSFIDYDVNSLSLEFYTNTHHKYYRINDNKQLTKLKKPYYLVIGAQNWSKISNTPQFKNATILNTFKYIKQEKFPQTLLNNNTKEKNLENIDLILVSE